VAPATLPGIGFVLLRLVGLVGDVETPSFHRVVEFGSSSGAPSARIGAGQSAIPVPPPGAPHPGGRRQTLSPSPVRRMSLVRARISRIGVRRFERNFPIGRRTDVHSHRRRRPTSSTGNAMTCILKNVETFHGSIRCSPPNAEGSIFNPFERGVNFRANELFVCESRRAEIFLFFFFFVLPRPGFIRK